MRAPSPTQLKARVCRITSTISLRQASAAIGTSSLPTPLEACESSIFQSCLEERDSGFLRQRTFTRVGGLSDVGSFFPQDISADMDVGDS